MDVTLHPAQESDRELIRNLFNMYQNDFAEYVSEFDSVDENGYFRRDTVDQILPFGGGVFPYIIRSDGKNVGIVMFTDERYNDCNCDWCLEELYLVRGARKKGIASSAVKLLMSAHPGKWCLHVFEKNAAALAFWKKIILSYGQTPVESPSEYPSMSCFRFRVE